MKKNNSKKYLIQRVALVGLSVVATSSIALTLHFNSLYKDSEQSNQKLNAKYEVVLVENEELSIRNNSLIDETVVLKENAKKSSELLEQSQTEIEKLRKEAESSQGVIKSLRLKVTELEKKQ